MIITLMIVHQVDDIARVKGLMTEALVLFERWAAPTRMTIMWHLPLHIPDQLLQAQGPARAVWMYPFERCAFVGGTDMLCSLFVFLKGMHSYMLS